MAPLNFLVALNVSPTGLRNMLPLLEYHMSLLSSVPSPLLTIFLNLLLLLPVTPYQHSHLMMMTFGLLVLHQTLA